MQAPKGTAGEVAKTAKLGSRHVGCALLDEAQFARGKAALSNALAKARDPYWKSYNINSCGYLEMTLQNGRFMRIPLTALHAKVGSPTWQVAVRTGNYFLSERLRGPYKSQAKASLVFEYASKDGRTVTRSELTEINARLRDLSKSTWGWNNTSVDIDAEMAGAAALQRAGARNRKVIGQVLTAVGTAAANTAASSPASNLRTFTCEIGCIPKNTWTPKKLSMRISALDAFAAEDSFKSRGLNKICRDSGFAHAATLLFLDDGISCQ
ncbi:MAG: hypothetical protein AAGD04_06720 [Pseudomonadota bacterium]